MGVREESISKLIKDINYLTLDNINIMEICGTHTYMIYKIGLKTLLSEKINLISGPGCPVCVTEENYIDMAVNILNKYSSAVIATFGDLMKVRGSRLNLMDKKSEGKNIEIVYSPLEVLNLAEKNKNKNIIFLGVGFETTAPVIALTIKLAAEKNVRNLFFLTSLKRMEPIINFILKNPAKKINGIICPGHVASIVGSDYFEFISTHYNIPAAVCGFEAFDILSGIDFLTKNIINDKHCFANLYNRCVSNKGNTKAKNIISEVFDISDGFWRGIGKVDASSYIINEKYKRFDCCSVYETEKSEETSSTPCQCKDIILGNKIPVECKLFGKICNPAKPCGPCMVSSEGACSIAYKFRGDKWKIKSG